MVSVTPSSSWTTGVDLVGAVHVAAERPQPGEQHGLGLVLGDHQRVRVGRGQPVERDGQQPAGAVADGEPGDRDAAGDQLLGGAQLVQHLQGAGVHDGGAGGVGALGQPVEDDEVDAGGGEGDGEREAGRAGADDGDLGAGGQSGGVHGRAPTVVERVAGSCGEWPARAAARRC